jgi:hypothetical protein
MFIREVRKTNGKTKKVYEYLHLVESVRTEKGPRQRLVLNLGNLDIEPGQYKAFARRIEDMLTGQQSIVKVDEKLEKYARKAVGKIFRKQSKELSAQQEAEYEMVNINSLESEQIRGLGAEYLCHRIWNELEMNSYLIGAGISKRVVPLLEAVVVGRLVDPGSEKHTKEWAENRSAIYELTGEPLRNSLNSYYRAGDKLYSLKTGIEKHLCAKERDLFSLSEKMVFIDLSNTYFEGDAKKNAKAKYGRSKDKRKDCKLVTLGLIIDEMGFAKYSQFFPGNQPEGDTLAEMIKSMEENFPLNSKDKTIIMDAGIATGKNIEWIKNNSKYHYIVVNGGEAPVDIDYNDMKVIRHDENKDIKIEVKRFIHEDELYLVCKSQQKELKETSMRKRVEELFVERLSYYKKGLSIPRRTKRYKKIIELIGRLKEKYPSASKLYEVEVFPEKDKKATAINLLAVDIEFKRKENLYEEELSKEGSYILRSDRFDLSDKEIWKIYTMLTQIEAAFLNLKSFLGLRPNYHQTEDRADTHIFISVLAYHISHIIGYRLRQRGDVRKWKTIRDVLKTHERLTISYQAKDEDGSIHQEFVRVNSRAEPAHLEIYKKLNLSQVPLPRKKMKGK